MLHISPIYLESACVVYADFFESRLYRERLATLGHWQGRGAKALGLKNPIELKVLENLMNGLTPDGSRGLVPDAGDPKRIAAWQAVFEAPLVLSNAWGVAPREARVRIERGFVQGVNRALRCFEDVVTGVGTLAPRPDTPKAVMAVFRTNASWDLTAELKATALLMNAGLQSQTKAVTFIPSQMMGFESGLRDFFMRALYARLDEQVGRVRSFSSKWLRFDQLIEDLFNKAAMDATQRSTWARRDDRGAWAEGKTELSAHWRAMADNLAFKACWSGNLQAIGRPARFLADLIKEIRDRRPTNGHVTEEASKALAEQAEHAQERRRALPVTKPKSHFHGHSH